MWMEWKSTDKLNILADDGTKSKRITNVIDMYPTGYVHQISWPYIL